ncbi:MAG: YncE family protein [Acidobacteriota bacterium]
MRRLGVLLGVAFMAIPGTSRGLAASPYLYVCNQADASVSVIDMETDEVVRTVDLEALGFSAHASPHHIAVEPDGSYWYVSLISDGRVLKFDRHDRLVGQVEFEAPGLLALDPTSKRLFVGRSMAAVRPPKRIGVIDREAMTIEDADVFISRPHAIAVARDGRYAYMASLAENRIVALDPLTEDITSDLFAADAAEVLVQFAVSPDGYWMVAGGQISGKFLVFDLSQAPHVTLVKSIPVNTAPWHPVFSPDGRFVYVGNQGANTVTVIDTADWSVAAVIAGEGIAEPHGAAVSADGKKLYVSSHNLKGEYVPAPRDGEGARPRLSANAASGAKPDDGEPRGTVVVIDTESRQILKVIEVGHYASGVGSATR